MVLNAISAVPPAVSLSRMSVIVKYSVESKVRAVALPASASSFVLPTPGSSAEVSRLVAESVSRHVAPATLNPTVDLMGKDWYWNILPKAKCVDVVCSWGPTHPHRTIVLFGDSHAEMWAAAMEPAVVSVVGGVIEMPAPAVVGVAAVYLMENPLAISCFATS